jgi:hypothetical protein
MGELALDLDWVPFAFPAITNSGLSISEFDDA